MATLGGIVVATGGAPTTGRRIFLDVIDELARPVDAADTTIRAYAADAFRAAVRTMNRKGLWPWEILDEDVAITSNIRFSTVSGAIKKPLAMHFLNGAGGTRDQRITYMSYDRFMETYSMDFTSEPHTYTIPNLFETGQIRWHPIPASNDNARLTYYRVTPVPRSEQEAIEIPETAIEAYMSFAWYEFLKRIPSQQRPFPITLARSEMKQAFRELSAHVNAPGDRIRRVTSGGYGAI
jgi:hypothetical protein